MTRLASTLCSAEITFKTDPKNTDYAAEHGASRNFEPWRDTGDSAVAEADRLEQLEAEENNPMAALETRTMDSKREMAIMDALSDARARNARHERLVRGVGAEGIGAADPDELIRRLELEEPDEEDEETIRLRQEAEEDEALVREVFEKQVDGHTLKRKADTEAPDLQSLLTRTTTVAVKPTASVSSSSSVAPPAKKAKVGGLGAAALGIKVVKKKKPATAAV